MFTWEVLLQKREEREDGEKLFFPLVIRTCLNVQGQWDEDGARARNNQVGYRTERQQVIPQSTQGSKEGKYEL